MKATSLTRRLVIYSLSVQFAGSFVAWSLALLLEISGLVGNFDVALPDYGYNRIRSLIIESLVMEPSGLLHIEPSSRLRALMKHSSDLQFAVFKNLEEPALPGSSEGLSLLVQNDKKLRIRGQRFSVRNSSGDEARGSVQGSNTKYGPLYIAASGFTFIWTDWFQAFSDDADFIGFFVVLVGSVSAVVTWLGVHTALAPLRRAAVEAEGIDMKSLGQGITTAGVPLEIEPLINAVNAALARLDENVVRMRRYTANAAHELRTPLAILRARLQNPEETNFKADLERDASQLQGIVEQLLIAARLGERQVSAEEDLNLAEAVWSVVAGRTPLAIKCNRRLEFEEPGSVQRLRGNRRAIESVVANLVDNALRAEPEGGTILVRVTSQAIVEVIDHGEGVEDSDRQLIFEAFWRKNEGSQGTGLGLAIAKEVMEFHGGRIWVEETQGGGATFKMSFPQLKIPSA